MRQLKATKLSLTGKDEPSATLRQHNQIRAQRTVELTRQAIAKLKGEGQKVTLVAIAEATRGLDESGKGLVPNTILRNVEARELFHEQSESYQARRERAQKVKRRRSDARSRTDPNQGAEYRGLRPSDLIQIINQLKATVRELVARQDKLQAERTALRDCCNELREQNTRQLAALTKLQMQLSD